jgi:hypothetical protein
MMLQLLQLLQLLPIPRLNYGTRGSTGGPWTQAPPSRVNLTKPQPPLTLTTSCMSMKLSRLVERTSTLVHSTYDSVWPSNR